jgi:hypothetical protein
MLWDGRRWREIGIRREGSLYAVDAVDAVSSSETWATHTGVVRGDVQRWNGRTWNVVRVFPARSMLEDVAAVSTNDVWAVGPSSYSEQEGRPLIVHWDGRSWQVQKTPFKGMKATLNGLSVPDTKHIWAVGDRLIARYSC